MALPDLELSLAWLLELWREAPGWENLRSAVSYTAFRQGVGECDGPLLTLVVEYSRGRSMRFGVLTHQSGGRCGTSLKTPARSVSRTTSTSASSWRPPSSLNGANAAAAENERALTLLPRRLRGPVSPSQPQCRLTKAPY